MKSFLKLSIAAVLFGAMMLGTSAFAAPVTADSSGKLDVGGVLWANTGYVQGFETAEGDSTEAPPATWEVAHETRLNVAWSYESVTAHWEYWQRDKLGGHGDVILGWISWMPSSQIRIDMGSAQDPSWSERAVDWETHLGVDAVGAPGAYSYLFPEGSRGTDITFLAGGGISAGLFISDKGLVTGKNTGLPSDAAASPVAAGTGTANTYVVHVEYKQDAIWVALLYGMESVTDATATDDEGNTVGWGDAEEVSNSSIGVSGSYNFGAGKVKFQYFMVDGDTFDAKDAEGNSVDAPTDMAVGLHFNVGEAMAFLEYDLKANGGKDDKGKVADATYARIGYKMPVATNTSLQVEYEMQNDGTSTASAPRVGFNTSF
jgi:hypothetical protein